MINIYKGADKKKNIHSTFSTIKGTDATEIFKNLYIILLEHLSILGKFRLMYSYVSGSKGFGELASAVSDTIGTIYLCTHTTASELSESFGAIIHFTV